MVSTELKEKAVEALGQFGPYFDLEFRIQTPQRRANCRGGASIQYEVAEAREKGQPTLFGKTLYVYGVDGTLGTAAILARPGEEPKKVVKRLFSGQCDHLCMNECIRMQNKTE